MLKYRNHDLFAAWGCLALVLSSPALTAATAVLVSSTLENKVHAYSVSGTNWVYTGVFASGVYGDLPLTYPQGLAQDANHRIYVGEQSSAGRVLRFDTNGTFLGAIGTNGVNFAGGTPQSLIMAPDGNLLMSLAFTPTNSNCIWEYTIASGLWSRFIPNSGAGYTLYNPRGLAFGPDGQLCVADRNNDAIRKFDGATGAFMSNLVSRAQPQALYWDTVSQRFLMSRTFNGVIESVTEGGAVTSVYAQSGSDGFLDVGRIEGEIAFTRYNSDRVDLVVRTNAALPVVSGQYGFDGPGHLLVANLPPRSPVGCPAVPGTVIKYSPRTSSIYLGSPAIVILPNGDYLASHDYFGAGSTENTLGQTFLYRSTNRGTNWTLLGQINQMVSTATDTNGCFWNHFIQLNGQLYSIANKSGSGGYMVMRRSTNNGGLWTYVEPPPVSTGRPFLTAARGPGHTYVVKHDRLWLGMTRGTGLSGDFGDNYIAAMFAPTNSDLLAPTNWSASTTVQRSTSWLGGTFKGWLEGNLLEDRLGGLVIMLRADNRYSNGAGIGGKAALVRVNYTGGTNATTSFSGGNFDPAVPNDSGFVDFPGGITRFTIRFDPGSQKYWTLCNYIPRKFRTSAYNAERFRAILALASSPDLRDWTIEHFVMFDDRLYSEDPTVLASAFDGNQTDYGFQYADWVFDGNDLIATVRTGFCDDFGGSNNGHDANYYLFRRVEDFRVNAGPDTLRILSLHLTNASGAVQIHFATRPARLYRLEFSDDLVTWQDSGCSWEGNGNAANFSLTSQPATRRFYRLAESTSWLP